MVIWILIRLMHDKISEALANVDFESDLLQRNCLLTFLFIQLEMTRLVIIRAFLTTVLSWIFDEILRFYWEFHKIFFLRVARWWIFLVLCNILLIVWHLEENIFHFHLFLLRHVLLRWFSRILLLLLLWRTVSHGFVCVLFFTIDFKLKWKIENLYEIFPIEFKDSLFLRI